MNNSAVMNVGFIRSTERCSFAAGARLDSMTATEVRAAATHRGTVGIRSQHGDRVLAAAEHEIMSEEGAAHSLDRHTRR